MKKSVVIMFAIIMLIVSSITVIYSTYHSYSKEYVETNGKLFDAHFGDAEQIIETLKSDPREQIITFLCDDEMYFNTRAFGDECMVAFIKSDETVDVEKILDPGLDGVELNVIDFRPVSFDPISKGIYRVDFSYRCDGYAQIKVGFDESYLFIVMPSKYE